jgi:hypothetical protein
VQCIQLFLSGRPKFEWPWGCACIQVMGVTIHSCSEFRVQRGVPMDFSISEKVGRRDVSGWKLMADHEYHLGLRRKQLFVKTTQLLIAWPHSTHQPRPLTSC